MTVNSQKLFAAFAMLAAFTVNTAKAQSQANPQILNYGYGQIVANPQYPIVGETATISVTVHNSGDNDATNVRVKVSFNDWGVTFNGWQQIGAIQTIPSIPGHGSATISVTNIFNNRTHTCVEAIISTDDENSDVNDDRGQINLEVINSGETFGYNVPVGNEGQEAGQFAVHGEGELADSAGQVRKVDVRVVPDVLNLAPGEFANVRVEANLAGLPVGTRVLVKVEAVRTNTPSTLDERNNVIFDITVTTAYKIKSDTVASLLTLSNDMPSQGLKNRVATAAKLVQLSLNRRFWNGDNRVIKRGGASVFAQEAAAIASLNTLLETDISLALKVRVDTAIRSICDGDRILAETSITDAGSPPAAVDKLADGDVLRASGRYFEAVKAYAEAWGMAVRP